ncbi:outer membrane beta-barrel protein [Fodinibius sp. Rm-B-1B1-1]|uniref:outer membrane beta-barrel protein n=1 Tax=Fodinibius alkaliphilus TaxID=3140241 RepID=UPI00315A8617
MRVIKYFLLATVLMLSTNSYAQNGVSENEQKNNFQVGLFYSINTNLSGDIELSDEIGYRTKYNRNNFTAGLDLQYSIIKSLALQSGMSYSNRDFSGTYYCNVCDFMTPPQQEEINLRFIQVPTALRYSNYFNNLGFFGKIGVLTQLVIEEPNNNEFYELETNSYSLSGILGAGIEYKFGGAFSTALSTNYANGLTQIFEDADYSYKTLGIQLDLSIEL